MAAEGGRIDFMFLGPSYLAAGSATGRSGNFGQITGWGHHLAGPGPATYDERLISVRHQYVDGQALSCVKLDPSRDDINNYRPQRSTGR